MESNSLNILAVIGFNGNTMEGLILHPDNENVIYPVGNQIVVRNVLTREQRFLRVSLSVNYRDITTKYLLLQYQIQVATLLLGKSLSLALKLMLLSGTFLQVALYKDFLFINMQFKVFHSLTMKNTLRV
jgi:hypothetical protein